MNLYKKEGDIVRETMIKKMRQLLRELSIDYGLWRCGKAAIAYLYLAYADYSNHTNKELLNYAEGIISHTENQAEVVEKFKIKFSELEINQSIIQDLCMHVLLGDYFREDYEINTSENLGNIVEKLLELKDGDTLLDVGSGYGAFLLQAYLVAKENDKSISLKGIEINTESANLSKMILDMIGSDNDIVNDSVLKNDLIPSFDKGYIFPPIGMKNTNDIPISPKFKDLIGNRTEIEWLFILNTLEKMSKNGRCIAIVPEGILFRRTCEIIRKYIIDNQLLEGIISLPSGTFFPYSGVKTDILIFSNGNTKVKLIDAEKSSYQNKKGKAFTLDAKTILSNYYENSCKSVEYEVVRENDYNLSPTQLLNDFEIESEKLKNPVVLESVAEVLVGSQYTTAKFNDVISDEKTEYMIARSSDIQNGILNYDSMPYIKEDKKLEKFALCENDVVMTTKSSVVKTAVAKELPSEKIIVTGGMIIIRPNLEKINPLFLKLFLDSQIGIAILKSIQRGTVISNISARDLKNIKIECPDIEIQNSIARKYNAKLSTYTSLVKQAKELENQLNSFYDEYQIEEEWNAIQSEDKRYNYAEDNF